MLTFNVPSGPRCPGRPMPWVRYRSNTAVSASVSELRARRGPTRGRAGVPTPWGLVEQALVFVERGDDVGGEVFDETQAPRQQRGHGGRVDARGAVVVAHSAGAEDVADAFACPRRRFGQPVGLRQQVAHGPGPGHRGEEVFAQAVGDLAGAHVGGVGVEVGRGDLAEAGDPAGRSTTR
jgi:hypothetical protein